MTNEEAIYEIKNTPISEILTHPRFKEALDMAIEALELHDIIAEMLENAQPVIETDGDLISREDALNVIRKKLAQRDEYMLRRYSDERYLRHSISYRAGVDSM